MKSTFNFLQRLWLPPFVFLTCCLFLNGTAEETKNDGKGQFVFHCKDEPLSKVLKSVEQHFGRKVQCQGNEFNELGNQKVSVDIKSDSFWPAVCEISRQSDFGFIYISDFMGGVFFDSGTHPVTVYEVVGSGVLVLSVPVYLLDAQKKRAPEQGMDLILYGGISDLGPPLMKDFSISWDKNKSIVLKPYGGESRLEYAEWIFALPLETKNQTITFSCNLKVGLHENKKEYSLKPRTGEKILKDGLTITCKESKHQKDSIGVEYSVEWDSGLKKEDVERSKIVREAFMAGKEPSKKDLEWLEQMEGKITRNHCLIDVSVQSPKGVKGKNTSTMNSSGFGEITGEAIFKQAVDEDLQLIFTIAEVKPLNKVFNFPNISLKEKAVAKE